MNSAYGYLAASIIMEIVATNAMKASQNFTKTGPTILMIVGYGLAFYCLSVTIRTLPLGIAYAIWSGVGIILVSLTAWWLFGQALDVWAIVGITFIVIGVMIINLLSENTSI